MQTCTCDLVASPPEVMAFTPFLCKGRRSKVVIQSRRIHNLIWLATRNGGDTHTDMGDGTDGREQVEQSPC